MKTLVIAALSIVLCGAVYSKVLSPSVDSPITHTLDSVSRHVDAVVHPANRRLSGAGAENDRKADVDRRNVNVSDYVALHKTRTEQLR